MEEEEEKKEQYNLFDGLNMYSVTALQQMGYTDERIASALRHLRQQKNYTSLGEVDKAIELLTKEVDFKIAQLDKGLKNSPVGNITQAQQAMLDAIKSPSQQEIPRVDLPDEGVEVCLTSKSITRVFAWGDNSQG